MAFHAEVFPLDISYGSSGGPGYKTVIQSTDSGHEFRVSSWDNPRHRYDASYGVKSLDDMYTVIKFYHAREGALHGFLWKDALDYSTDSTARGTAAFGDVSLGTFSTAGNTIQLRKGYVNGSTTKYRTITKPISGTVVVGWDSNGDGTITNQTSGWSVDTATGLITITDSSANSKTIKAGCQFYVPVRFGEGADETLSASIDSFEIASIGSIPIVEIKDDAPIPNDFYYGGAKEYSANASHSLEEGRVVYTSQSSGNIEVTLPTFTNNWAVGGPYFYFVHKGSGGSLLIKYGGSTLATLGNGEGAVVHLLIDGSGTRSWGVWA
tara:strand:+ start:16765 stop:17733 length:969 start_codon:yes stop_codon:yes gene_type:complete